MNNANKIATRLVYYWEYKSFCREDNATLSGPSQNSLWSACKTGIGPAQASNTTYASHARTFPKAVQGNVTEEGWSFDESTGAFQMSYLLDASIRMPTEISLSPLNCGGAVTLAWCGWWVATSTCRMQPQAGCCSLRLWDRHRRTPQ